MRVRVSVSALVRKVYECLIIYSYFLTVGRTGSGKSTLTLAILRCIYTEGAVLYDGVATNQINLDALRSNITIIPQSVRRCLLTSLHRISDLCVLMITSRAHTYSRSY